MSTRRRWERRKRRRGAPGAKEGRREEWFTCIASIALAQGQRVCETEDQTGSGPPSFQFPAPCSLTALSPLSCFARHLTMSLLSLLSFPLCVPRLSDTQTIASCTRAATFQKLITCVGGFSCRQYNAREIWRNEYNNIRNKHTSNIQLQLNFLYVMYFINHRFVRSSLFKSCNNNNLDKHWTR